MSTGRIYFKFGEDYQNYDKLDLVELLNEVAFRVRTYNNKKLVEQNGNKENVCLRRTKTYIADKTQLFVNQFGRVRGEHIGDHMGEHVSVRQINLLIKSLAHRDRRVSCYSLAILHIIYVELKQAGKTNESIKKLAELIYNLANRYLRDHENILAQYLVDSYCPVIKELNSGTICTPDDFPPIHRRF